MGIDISARPVRELDPKTFRKLKWVNLGTAGLMRFYLEDAYEEPHPLAHKTRRNETVMILYQDGKIACWALLLDHRACSVCRWKPMVHIYTRPKARKQGFARILMRQIVDSRPMIRLYCQGNKQFFKKFGVKHV